VLRQLARIIRSSLRSEDLAFRYGGEEILLLLYRQQLGRAERAADRIRQKIASVPFPTPGTEMSAHVTISCGVASYPEHFDNTTGWMGLVGSADQALYKAKNAVRIGLEDGLAARGESHAGRVTPFGRREKSGTTEICAAMKDDSAIVEWA